MSSLLPARANTIKMPEKDFKKMTDGHSDDLSKHWDRMVKDSNDKPKDPTGLEKKIRDGIERVIENNVFLTLKGFS